MAVDTCDAGAPALLVSACDPATLQAFRLHDFWMLGKLLPTVCTVFLVSRQQCVGVTAGSGHCCTRHQWALAQN